MDESSPLYLPRSDIEEAQWNQQQQNQQNVAQQLLTGLGHLLDHAESGLDQLEKNDMLGSAIIRRCQELADAVGNLASQLDQQSDKERRDLARACLSDAQQQLQLVDETSTPSRGASSSKPTEDSAVTPHSRSTQLARMTEDDVVNAIAAASSFLRDVESALRGVDPNDADEIADAALIAARLFLISLKSFHDKLDPESIMPQQQSSRETSMEGRIEYLQDMEEGNVSGESSSSTSNQKWTRKQRIRALWPPLGPAVGEVLSWGKDEAVKRPLLAVALGITLWPVAVCTAFVGTPIVLADGMVQQVYQNCQEKPLVQGLEIGVAQLYQTGRLTLLCGKLVGKQTLRVISHQVKEHGGVGSILEQAGQFALDRVAHPIESLSMTWNGVVWGASALRDSWQFVASTVANADERDSVTQSLQQ
jgi:hypothetical protein